MAGAASIDTEELVEEFQRSWEKKFRCAALAGGNAPEEELPAVLAEIEHLAYPYQWCAAKVCRRSLREIARSDCSPVLGVAAAALIVSHDAIVPATTGAWLASTISELVRLDHRQHAEAILNAFLSRGDVDEPHRTKLFDAYISMTTARGATWEADFILQNSAFAHTRVAAEELVNACRRAGGVHVVRWMLSLPPAQRPDTNHNVGSPLSTACAAGNADTVQALLAVPPPDGVDVHLNSEGAASIAAQAGAAQCLAQLLALEGERRVDVNANRGSIWLNACGAWHNALECVQLLLSLPASRGLDVHARGDAAIAYAAEERNVEVIRLLLSLEGERALNIHIRDESAFSAALAFESVASARELLLQFTPSCGGADETHAQSTQQKAEIMQAAVSKRLCLLLDRYAAKWDALAGKLATSGNLTRCGQRLLPVISTAIEALTGEYREIVRHCAGLYLWRDDDAAERRPARRHMVLHRAARRSIRLQQ